MARIIGVNGIHNWSWSKDSFTDRFLRRLSELGHKAVDVHYPRMWAIFAFWNAPIERRAMAVAEANKSPSDCVLAHSAGCEISRRAMLKGAKFDKVFFFGAAVEDLAQFPSDAFNVLYNFYSEDDFALKVGEALPFDHPFGGMGLTGYAGDDKRIVNVKCAGMGHNDYSKEPYLTRYSAKVQRLLVKQ